MTAGGVAWVRAESLEVHAADGTTVFFRESLDMLAHSTRVRDLAYDAERVIVIALNVDDGDNGTHVVTFQAGPPQADHLLESAGNALLLAAAGIAQAEAQRTSRADHAGHHSWCNEHNGHDDGSADWCHRAVIDEDAFFGVSLNNGTRDRSPVLAVLGVGLPAELTPDQAESVASTLLEAARLAREDSATIPKGIAHRD